MCSFFIKNSYSSVHSRYDLFSRLSMVFVDWCKIYEFMVFDGSVWLKFDVCVYNMGVELSVIVTRDRWFFKAVHTHSCLFNIIIDLPLLQHWYSKWCLIDNCVWSRLTDTQNVNCFQCRWILLTLVQVRKLIEIFILQIF